MKEEISAAVKFLTRIVGRSDCMDAELAERFRESLDAALTERFRGHWFPEEPCKGQAYRCIRVNGRGRRDPVLERVAGQCGLKYDSLQLPVELTLWVDPDEVCCRFGEDEGSYCTVASFKDNKENVSDNLIEEIHKSSSVHKNFIEGQKKQKSRRKPFDKQKNKTNSRPPSLAKSYPPYVNYKDLIPAYFDLLNPAMTNRMPRNNYYAPPHDSPFVRRPRKNVRNVYSNERYHWGKK